MEPFVLLVCRGTACHIRKSAQVLQAVFDATGTSPEQPVSADGRFHVQVTSCLEMCGEAPAVLVNGVPETRLTPERARELIQTLKEKTE